MKLLTDQNNQISKSTSNSSEHEQQLNNDNESDEQLCSEAEENEELKTEFADNYYTSPSLVQIYQQGYHEACYGVEYALAYPYECENVEEQDYISSSNQDECVQSAWANRDQDHEHYLWNLKQFSAILATLADSAAKLGQLSSQYADLRPKFPLLKHKTEHLSQNQTETNNRRSVPRTPDWFLNMPTTRSPFPSFASKIPDEIED